MNLRDLRYLVALAETRHFGQAAERCFVSQPTLSAQIKKLEQRLGVQLVERHHRGLILTDVGEEVVVRARRVVQEADQIVELARSRHDPMAGTLKVGLIPTLGPYLLPFVVPVLTERFPRLRLLLFEYQTAPLLQHLREGGLDLGLLALPVAGEALATRLLFDEPFLVALPAAHPLAGRSRLDLSDLQGEVLLLLEDGHCLRDQALEACALAGVQESQDFRATSLETLRQMVAAGTGVTLLPQLAVHQPVADASLLAIRPFRPPEPARHIGGVWRKNNPRRETLDNICDVVVEVIRQRATRAADE